MGWGGGGWVGLPSRRAPPLALPSLTLALPPPIAIQTPQRAFLIRCSYLEIYNEQITDLLAESKEKEKVDIHESKARVSGVA